MNQKFVLDDYHRDVPDEDLLADVRRVSQLIGKKTVKLIEYRKHGRFHDATLCSRFGPWNSVLRAAGLDESPFRMNISDEEMFDNLFVAWTRLGRQPGRRDMIRPDSKFSERPYIRRFGGWRKALEAFVFWANKDDTQPLPPKQQTVKTHAHITTRYPGPRLQFKVMRRDDFKCRICGRSPATHPGLILHVDHVVPWSKGGETVFNNLQTLCEEHNLGKSDLDMNENDAS